MEHVILTCKSYYAMMSDGVRLAISPWLPEPTQHNPDDNNNSVAPRPAVLMTTRYWRAKAFRDDKPELQGFYSAACHYFSKGYILVMADARGSGASFGHRETEIGPQEVDDIGELINWVAEQDWCDGRVATTGTSYTANTTLHSLVTAPKALKVGVCRAPDFDPYRHLLAPGGIPNFWFIENWGDATSAQDNNDVEALYNSDYWPTPAGGADNVLGVRPVDEDTDGSLLAAAVAEHKSNFNLAGSEENLRFFDNNILGNYRYFFQAPYRQQMEASQVPLVIRCGWHDAGTQLGALSMYASFINSPIQVILGPWNHGADFRADPFQPGDGLSAEPIALEDLRAMTVGSLDSVLKSDRKPERAVEYYTLGENRWKTTRQWPLPNTHTQRWYLHEHNQLILQPPTSEQGSDHYQVDPTTGSGMNNRWHAQMAGNPVLFPDRQQVDKQCLIYDTPPLESDTEITGHPVVHLQLSSTATDGQFFVYLETIDPNGRVRLLTEGQLRGLHRKASNETPPYTMFGPYHSLKEKDALPMVPGEITEIAFDLFPISVLLKQGQRLRVAIAGADKDTFAAIKGCESPALNIQRNRIYSSYLDLPVIAR